MIFSVALSVLILSSICCLGGMAVSALDDDNTFDPHFSRSWDTTPSHAPTLGYFGGAWTPSLGSASPGPAQRVECRSPIADPVSLTQMVDEETLGEQLSDCIRYTYLIEWRLVLNNRVIATNTEQDLTEPPSMLWPEIMDEMAKILRGKLARDRRVRPDDTNVVVSVKDRSQRDLIKRFESTDIN